MGRPLTEFEDRRTSQMVEEVEKIEEKLYGGSATKEERKALRADLDAANQRLATFLNKIVA